MDLEALVSLLREQFAEKIGGRALGPDTQLREDLLLDSLDLLTLAAAAENVCGQPVLDETTAPAVFKTVGSFQAHLALLPCPR
jgi:acyl carrier protein